MRFSSYDLQLVVHLCGIRSLAGKKMTEVIGTPEYMAPEQICGRYGPEVDVWSAGCVLYVSMCAVPPFWASSREGVQAAILAKELKFKHPKWANVSEECKDLISKMLTKDPTKRVTPLAILGEFSSTGSVVELAWSLI